MLDIFGSFIEDDLVVDVKNDFAMGSPFLMNRVTPIKKSRPRFTKEELQTKRKRKKRNKIAAKTRKYNKKVR